MIRMMDTIRTNVHNIPQSCNKVAGYVTGTGSVPWTDTEWGMFPNASHVKIDQWPGTANPFDSDVKDVEAGAGRITDFITMTLARWNQRQWNYDLYIDAANAAAATAACRSAGLPTEAVELWIADWRLNETQATAQLGNTVNGYPIVALQWASPSSNPNTVVPGSTLTLAQANIDLSVTVDQWFPYPGWTPPVPKTITAGLTLSVGGTQVQFPITSDDDGHNWVG